MTRSAEATPRASKSSWSLIRWVLGFTVPHWKGVVAVILLTIIYSGGNSLRILLIGLIFDGVVIPAQATGEKSRSQEFFDLLPWLPQGAKLRTLTESRFETASFEITGAVWDPDHEAAPREEKSGRWRVSLIDGQVVCRELDGAEHRTPFQKLSATFERAPPAVDPAAFSGSTAEIVISKGDEGAEGIFPLLVFFAAVVAVLALVISISSFFMAYLAQSVVVRTVAAMREALFAHFGTLSLNYFGGSRRGDLISRLNNDVGAMHGALRYMFGDLLQHPITLLFCLGLAFYASWELSLIVIPFLPLLVLPMLKSGRKVKKHGRGSLMKLGEVTETLSQFLSGIRVVKAFGMEKAQQKEFETRNAGFIRSNMKVVRHKSISRSGVEGVYNLLAALVLLAGGWLLAGDALDLNLADLAVFIGAVMSLYRPLKSVVRAYNTIQESLAGAERVCELMEVKPTVTDREGATPFLPLENTIRFDHVAFRYGPDEPWVLQDVDFTVERGQTIAVVGPSGAGKSTLLDLLARFYDVVEGRILLDEKDLRDGLHASLLHQVAYVGQDPFLFHTSIIENLRDGKPDATEEEIVTAARDAAIHDEILATPLGYDTVIGERGMSLSGGQRQRLTIARALLKDAGILLLDEATSALDTESERKVQDALQRLMQGRTTFVIAHRLSTIRHADRILVLDSGRLVESGTHDELLERGGTYSRLLELQELRESHDAVAPSRKDPVG